MFSPTHTFISHNDLSIISVDTASGHEARSGHENGCWLQIAILCDLVADIRVEEKNNSHIHNGYLIVINVEIDWQYRLPAKIANNCILFQCLWLYGKVT